MYIPSSFFLTLATISSRPRLAHNSGKRKQQKEPEPVVVSEEEEEGDEEESVQDESVTRCVCGKQHSIGLMVCCDNCEVWQHCECMGLEEEDIPDQYFCDKCRPEDHVEIKGYDNKTRRYYKPSKTEEGNRETSMSSQEESTKESIEPIVSETVANPPIEENLENKLSRPKRRSTKTEKKPRSSGNTNTRKWTQTSSRRPNKTPRSRTSTPQPEIPTPTSTSSLLFEHLSPLARETSPPAKARTPSARMTISEMNKRANQILKYVCSLQVEMTAETKRERDDSPEDDEVSKKQKLIDAQISETMTKAMVELEKDNYDTSASDGGKPTPILIPHQFDRDSPSSSLSSASTIPLEEDRFMNTEKSVAEEALEMMSKPGDEQSSLEIMNTLTRKVIVFQRRFGQFSFGSLMTDDPESIEYEGPPITRSREFYQGKNTW